MTNKEAKARIKINKLLEQSGWFFEDVGDVKANIKLEANVKFNDMDDDFKDCKNRLGKFGEIDFLLLDKKQRPLVVVEAKRESINPLSAKEQARNYAKNIGARFIILSNGNIHYFWDTEFGNPEQISRFPTQDSFTKQEKYHPSRNKIFETNVDENFIIASQMPNYLKEPQFLNPATKDKFLKDNNLKQLRPYQLNAIKSLQGSVKNGNNRFLFEMATGTGKTLTSAGIIKLFLKTNNAQRVLFLVDRIELEDQALRDFEKYLKPDYTTMIYKEHRDDWYKAHIVISTVKNLLSKQRYKNFFSPTDFELLISDEAHRSIGGNSRAVFEYFIGYKLGLTATPKNYLKGVDINNLNTQKEYEKRLLLDTYKTFGCDNGIPTFSYDLETGANNGYLIKPTTVDARTEITTQLLSEQGYVFGYINDDGDYEEEKFKRRDYEKKLFNEQTNITFCQTLIEKGLYDPIAKKLGIELFGKTIVFCVSQDHASKITNILNQIAIKKWPEIYGNSNFAVQITSYVKGANKMTINFTNNNLNDRDKQIEGYETSKTRIAVTVGMMTTGYDCPDILNIALMRPIFSPSEFVQMKGRGTRKNKFEFNDYVNDILIEEKTSYKLFDFFANCQFFEKDFKYDDVIKLPKDSYTKSNDKEIILNPTIDLATDDKLQSIEETPDVIMRVDREGFKEIIKEDISDNEILRDLWQNGEEKEAEYFVNENIFNKTKNFINLEKIRKIFEVDRKISTKEFLQFAFGEKDKFESKDDLLENEWQEFANIYHPSQEDYFITKDFFKAYICDEEIRNIINTNNLSLLNTSPSYDFNDYKKLGEYKKIIPQYINDYVNHLTNL